jgi:type III restriction enzyme
VAAGEEEDEPSGKRGKAKARTVYGQGRVFPEYFSNTATAKRTIRIDTKLLAQAESDDPGKNRQTAAQELRHVIATVGKRGQPGEHVRCVVSVSMLTEGWDANNVTHILGLRAFGSQLLCEQVVGRGLRRMSYEPDPQTGLLTEEYVDVYGIPFSVIPFKGREEKGKAPEDKPRNRVWALPDRAQTMKMRFPNVEGYVFALVKNIVQCDVDGMEPLEIDPNLEPVTTFLRPTAGYVDSEVQANGFDCIPQDRATYYSQTHFQSILFQVTQMVIDSLLAHSSANGDQRGRVWRLQSRHQLFPQVFGFVQRYIDRRVRFNGVDRRELGLERYVQMTVQRLVESIRPDDASGEPPLIPILNRFRPVGSTEGVDFPTTRPVTPSKKSHINLVVQHSDWEAKAAAILDSHEAVETYARNDHLGLVVPYEYLGNDHSYEPDFIVRLNNQLQLLLEIKGYEVHNRDQTHQKHTAAKKWTAAVNNLREFGTWDLLVCRDLETLPGDLGEMSARCVVA